MSLREKINEQFNIALKSKNKTLVSTLRLILQLLKKEILQIERAKKRNPLKMRKSLKFCED